MAGLKVLLFVGKFGNLQMQSIVYIQNWRNTPCTAKFCHRALQEGGTLDPIESFWCPLFKSSVKHISLKISFLSDDWEVSDRLQVWLLDCWQSKSF